MQAKFTVKHSGPSVSIQDDGRIGHKRFGVSNSGVMDRTAFAIANTALENEANTPAIEISLGGISIECTQGSITLAIVGGCFSSQLNNKSIPPWCMFTIKAGDTLKIRPGAWGSWTYLAFAGLIESENWLDSYSVHLNSGMCGKQIQQGDELTVKSANVCTQETLSLGAPDAWRPPTSIRVVLGPQDRFFDQSTIDKLFSSSFTVSAEYDRMGMRLNGCALPINAALDMPSEPISRGSLQVPGHGNPLCLLADHQSAGGYPKIATVISADQDGLAQHRTGDAIEFKEVSAMEAVNIARETAANLNHSIEAILQNKISLTERLWRHNLISGTSTGRD